MGIIITIAMITGFFCYYQNNKISITNLKVKSNVNKTDIEIKSSVGNIRLA